MDRTGIARGGRKLALTKAASAFFDSTSGVDEALRRLSVAGVPRDLIEIAVSAEAAGHFYGRSARGSRRQTVRYAAIGGLVGLIAGSLLSLILIAIPGFNAPGITSLVQLIGPNVATIMGALIGALIGVFVQRLGPTAHRRVMSQPSSILIVVAWQDSKQAAGIVHLLREPEGPTRRLKARTD